MCTCTSAQSLLCLLVGPNLYLQTLHWTVLNRGPQKPQRTMLC